VLNLDLEASVDLRIVPKWFIPDDFDVTVFKVIEIESLFSRSCRRLDLQSIRPFAPSPKIFRSDPKVVHRMLVDTCTHNELGHHRISVRSKQFLPLLHLAVTLDFLRLKVV